MEKLNYLLRTISNKHHLRPRKNNRVIEERNGVIWVHLYWEERIFDELLYSKAENFKAFREEFQEAALKELPEYHCEWGSSDGHLFAYFQKVDDYRPKGGQLVAEFALRDPDKSHYIWQINIWKVEDRYEAWEKSPGLFSSPLVVNSISIPETINQFMIAQKALIEGL